MIDFRLVKSSITIGQVLDHFAVVKGEENYICPFCEKETLKVKEDKNCFLCVHPSCKESGNILDFTMKRLSHKSVKESAEYLHKTFMSKTEVLKAEVTPKGDEEFPQRKGYKLVYMYIPE